MFGALRQGSPLFVLDKQNGPTLKIGNIVSVTQPTGFNTMPWVQNMPGQTVDAVVRFEDGTQNEYQKLQTNLSVAVYGNTVVTETRELMQQEVESMARNAKAALETVDYNKGVLVACEDMMKKLSPSFAKERELEERLGSLELGFQDIKEIKSILAQMMAGHSPSEKSNPKTE